MEHTWTKDFYQETDPAKRQQILKEHIGEEEAWEEEYRDRLWTARYGQRRLQKDEFVKCLVELKYLAEGTSLDLGGDRKKTGARILSTLCLAEAMQSDEGYQKILADELYNVFLKFIQVSRGGRGFTSLVFGMGQLSEEGIAKKIAEQISVIAFKAPRLLHMEKAGSQKRTKHDPYRHGIFCRTASVPISHTTDAMTAPTPACIPASSCESRRLLRKRSYKNERTVRMRNGGRIVAIIATSAPEIPASLYPTTIALFTAIAPGADCAMAIKSSISSSSIQWYSSTNFFFINVTIT